MQSLELEAHLFSELGIEVAERLIEQKHLGLSDQSASQRNPLLLSTAQVRSQTHPPNRPNSVVPELVSTRSASSLRLMPLANG